jgi:hypothetical protein
MKLVMLKKISRTLPKGAIYESRTSSEASFLIAAKLAAPYEEPRPTPARRSYRSAQSSAPDAV